jgi:toxin secretion/phage lysis holin
MSGKTTFDFIIAVIGAIAAFMFGELDSVFYALIALVVLDYITGIISAVIQKKLSSAIGFVGILKKIMVFVVVAVANIICTHIGDGSGVLRTAVIFFFIANEGLSILENAGRIGLPIPKKLLNVLEQLKSKNEGDSEQESVASTTQLGTESANNAVKLGKNMEENQDE